MGRLFWKFFLSILLAQVAATIGIGGTVWLRDQARQRSNEPTLDTSPPATIMLDAATATLRHGGIDALHTIHTIQPTISIQRGGRPDTYARRVWIEDDAPTHGHRW